MERASQLKQEAEKIINEGRRPSASLLAEELGWNIHDVHRCLNFLEKKGEAFTYTKEVMKDNKVRMVGLKR
ncbi:MAG: hypothetical protein ABEJ93_01420 [Candidatus Nanohalobium sp.]